MHTILRLPDVKRSAGLLRSTINLRQEVLDQSLRLGSLTAKNPVSDLGKFGMGLVTAGLSLARRTTVITRQGETFLTSVVDVDEVIKRNSFCKYLRQATKEQRELFETVIPDGSSGTMRNNREIKAADTLDAFTKHNDFNCMRGELFLTGDLDAVVGIDFTKREVVFDQSFKDQLLTHLRGQCTTIKRQESRRTRVKESEEIAGLHLQAEHLIDQKAMLLLTPKANIEKRGPRIEKGEPAGPGPDKRIRKHFKETQEGRVRRCKFEYAKLGPHGQIYECDL